MGEVTDRSLCAEQMEGTDSGRTKRGIVPHAEPHKKFQAVISTRKKVNSDGYMSGDPVYFAWNNRRNPPARGRLEMQANMSVNAATLHVIIRGTRVASILRPSWIF